MAVGDRQKLITGIVASVLNEQAHIGISFDWFINKHTQENFGKHFMTIDKIFTSLHGDNLANQSKRTRTLDCDAYFGGQHNFIFEFDEHQHFSSARLKTFEFYPTDLKTNFNVDHWKERNASRYVVWKDKKQFAADLKPIYTAANKDLAWTALEKLEDIWGKKYPHAIRSWKANWQDLSHFFDFPLEIRTMIYTTNIIENLNDKIRKYTKTKMSFPDDASVLKSVYLALREITRRWTLPVRNWNLVVNQFINIFGERCKI
jgi:hypothetical protein